MSQNHSMRPRLPKGVSAPARARGGRAFRATIRKGKGAQVHLGLYPTAWLAGFAYVVAARALGRDTPPLEIPLRRGTRRRPRPRHHRPRPPPARPGQRPEATAKVAPTTDDLLTLFEVTVVGFCGAQAGVDAGDHPEAGLDAAAGRLVDAAGLLFGSRSAGHPSPLDAMTALLARRLDSSFRRAELTREVLADDGDEPRRVARWLVLPDAASPGSRVRAFARRSATCTAIRSRARPRRPRRGSGWADVLGVSPPFDPDQVLRRVPRHVPAPRTRTRAGRTPSSSA